MKVITTEPCLENEGRFVAFEISLGQAEFLYHCQASVAVREKLKYHWIYEFVEIWQHFNPKYSTWKYPFHEIGLLQIQNKNTTFNSYLKTFFQSLSLRNLVGHRSLVPSKINLTKGWDQMKPNSYCWRQQNNNKMFGLIKARLKLSQS